MSSAAPISAKDPDLRLASPSQHDHELARWQRTLLPVMTLFVIALAVAFFVLSTRTLGRVGAFIEGEHGELREQIKDVISQPRASRTGRQFNRIPRTCLPGEQPSPMAQEAPCKPAVLNQAAPPK